MYDMHMQTTFVFFSVCFVKILDDVTCTVEFRHNVLS